MELLKSKLSFLSYEYNQKIFEDFYKDNRKMKRKLALQKETIFPQYPLLWNSRYYYICYWYKF